MQVYLQKVPVRYSAMELKHRISNSFGTVSFQNSFKIFPIIPGPLCGDIRGLEAWTPHRRHHPRFCPLQRQHGLHDGGNQPQYWLPWSWRGAACCHCKKKHSILLKYFHFFRSPGAVSSNSSIATLALTCGHAVEMLVKFAF